MRKEKRSIQKGHICWKLIETHWKNYEQHKLIATRALAVILTKITVSFFKKKRNIKYSSEKRQTEFCPECKLDNGSFYSQNCYLNIFSFFFKKKKSPFIHLKTAKTVTLHNPRIKMWSSCDQKIKKASPIDWTEIRDALRYRLTFNHAFVYWFIIAVQTMQIFFVHANGVQCYSLQLAIIIAIQFFFLSTA